MDTVPVRWREPQDTRAQIIARLVTEPNLSRRELADELGFGPATVSTQVRRLLEQGMLREGPAQIIGAGRPRIPLEVVGNSAQAAGIGLQPGSATIVVVQLDGSIAAEQRLELTGATPEEIAQELGVATSALAEATPGTWLGLGTALSGVVSPSRGLVRFSVVHNWRNVPLGRLLAAHHKDLPVLLANDISALAQRELFRPGVGTPRDFLLVSIGVGVGMALVRDHRVVTGESGASTEMGHVSVDPLGPPCRCGNNGCLQALVGLEALREAVSRVEDVPGSSATELAEQAAAHSQTAAMLDRAGYWLGRAVGGACTMLGLTHVLLTGESLPLWPYLSGGFEQGLAETVRTLATTPVIERRPWEPPASAVGAAAIILSHVISAS